MTAYARAKPITAEDFEKFDPEWRYDLIEGELERMPPPPGAEHGSLTMRLAWYSSGYVYDRRLGECFTAETRFVIERDLDTVLAPDWAFVRADRLPPTLPKGMLELAPDIVLDVRSPSDRAPDVARKVALWLRAGACLVWELDPDARVLTVHRADGSVSLVGVDGTLSGEDVLPGFQYALGELFH